VDFAVSVSLWTPLTHPHRHLPRQCCDISLWQHSSRFSDERHFRGSLYVDYLLVLRPSLWALTAFTIPKKKTPSNTRRRFFVNTDLVVLPDVASAFRSIVSGERLIHVMDVGRLMLLPYLSDTTLLTISKEKPAQSYDRPQSSKTEVVQLSRSLVSELLNTNEGKLGNAYNEAVAETARAITSYFVRTRTYHHTESTREFTYKYSNYPYPER